MVAEVAMVIADGNLVEYFSLLVSLDQGGGKGPVNGPFFVCAEALQVLGINSLTGNFLGSQLGLQGKRCSGECCADCHDRSESSKESHD